MCGFYMCVVYVLSQLMALYHRVVLVHAILSGLVYQFTRSSAVIALHYIYLFERSIRSKVGNGSVEVFR